MVDKRTDDVEDFEMKMDKLKKLSDESKKKS